MTREDREVGTHQTSLVLACGATECTYNELRECHAGQIEVGMLGGSAACMTYTPRNSPPPAGAEPMTTPS